MRNRPLVLLFTAVAALLLAALLVIVVAPAPEPTFAAGFSWTDLQGPNGGAAQALALNPQFPADPVVFAGVARDFGKNAWAGLGIFRSRDGGLTWPNRGGPATGAARDIAVSPDWKIDGYAAAALSEGVYATTDRGLTWTKLADPGSGALFEQHTIAVSKSASGIHKLLVAGPYGSLWRSSDNGQTWNLVATQSPVQRLRFSPTQSDVALCACGGIWRSIDAGATWTQVLAQYTAYDVAFAGDGNNAYATAANQLWRSKDAGQTWQAIPTPATEDLKPVGVSTDGTGVFAAAGSNLYRYDLGAGQLVTVSTNLQPTTILRLQPSPSFATDHRLLIGTLEGVFVSPDAGATFTASAGFAPFRVTALAPAPDALSGGDLFAGGDYGVFRRAAGLWQPINSGSLNQLARDLTDLDVSPAYPTDGTLFAAENDTSGIHGRVYKSTDRGASWHVVYSGMSIPGVAISPGYATDHRVYLLDEGRIFASTDSGETWTMQPFWQDSLSHYALRFELSPNFAVNHTIYAVGFGVWYSHDGGATWQEPAVAPPLNPTPTGQWGVGFFTVSPNDRAYVEIFRSVDTPDGLLHNQIWTSANQGVTWTQLSNAPDLPGTALAAGPGAAGADTLYYATHQQSIYDPTVMTTPDLYVSDDTGQTWRNLGAMPNGFTWALSALPAANQVLAGTVGAWLLNTAGMPTATPNPCRELIVNGGFEQNTAWRIPQTAFPAARNTNRQYSGSYSMLAGITSLTANVRSYSDFSQDVTLPTTQKITLRYQRWPLNTGATAAAEAAPDAALLAALDAAATEDQFHQLLEAQAGDLQYGMLIAPPGGAINYLYRRLDNQQKWIAESFDLSKYAGQTVRLQFGSYNDGTGPVAAQYFDEVSIQVCAPGASTPFPRAWLPYIQRQPGAALPPDY